MANIYDHWEPIPVTVNHYPNGEWSVTGIPLDRNILARSLYHYGHSAPNYPVPAIRYNVVNYASGDCIEIRSWKGSFDKPLIDKVYWKPV